MFRTVVVVRFIPNYDCFAHINLKTLGITNKNTNCIKISWEDRTCLLWCVDSHSAEGCISLNSAFARRLGVEEGTAVCVAPCPTPPPLQRITIHPDTEDDLEILESNALRLQENLLNQIRVVEKEQKMVMWVNPSLSINITASDTCTIQQQTEVVVSFQNKEQGFLSGNQNVTPEDGLIKPDTLINKEIKYYMDDVDKKLSKISHKEVLILGRIVVASKISDSSFKSLFETNQMFIVFIQSNVDVEEGVYNLKCMESISDNQERKPLYLSKNIFVNLKKTDVLPLKEFKLIDKYVPIVVTKSLSDLLSLGVGKKVILEKIVSDVPEPEVIELSPEFKDNPISADDLLQDFKKYVTTHFSNENPLLINDSFIINLLPYKNVSCQVTLRPSNVKFVRLFGEMFRRCKVSVNSEPVQPYDQITQIHDNFDVDDVCRNVESFETIVSNCTNILKYNITKETLIQSSVNKNHIIITGPPGSGKTMLCHSIVLDLGIWFTRLECRTIKGRKDAVEQFQKMLQLCEEHSPSVLICDDIETIIPQQSEEISHQDIAFYDMLVCSIRDLLKHCIGVFVLLTATSLDNINDGFHVTKGELIVPFHFSIPDLTQSERCQLLKFITCNSLFNANHVSDNDYNTMAVETDSFTVRDLGDYVTKRVFKAVKKAVHYRNKALELKGITDNDDTASKSNEADDIWKTIGGMKHIKQSLVEILCWPLKYPVLFPKQPGGVLLFGPPGTGKSLLGSCIAKLSQLSFICVKGPELLSKYIGQSEQAVRNLFEKAEKKKPCILFFDEFDSLVPRRGHDSTGVTDRVVNQLLTQLDGVEGAIKGVTVLAATSRPDLLDGALLRPGRFDTTIHCSMPDEADRLEIFQILSHGLKMSDDVSLEELAEMTDGFTGADIKSVLSTAQLQCLEEKIEELSSSENPSVSNDEAVVTRDHLLDALANTRPSLTPQQLRFYDVIYSRFLNKPLTEEEKVLQDQLTKRQRATLA